MTNDWIWLSHLTSSDTPAYGGGSAFETVPEKQICCGDSCNSDAIKISNYIGSHVDAPRHFISKAITIAEYSPSNWFFEKPVLIDIPVENAQIVTSEQVDSVIPDNIGDANLVPLITCGNLDRQSKNDY